MASGQIINKFSGAAPVGYVLQIRACWGVLLGRSLVRLIHECFLRDKFQSRKIYSCLPWEMF
jgi:hypothetical protein